MQVDTWRIVWDIVLQTAEEISLEKRVREIVPIREEDDEEEYSVSLTPRHDSVPIAFVIPSRTYYSRQRFALRFDQDLETMKYAYPIVVIAGVACSIAVRDRPLREKMRRESN